MFGQILRAIIPQIILLLLCSRSTLFEVKNLIEFPCCSLSLPRGVSGEYLSVGQFRSNKLLAYRCQLSLH